MTTLPTFAGTPAERTLAEQIHEVMRMQGHFFASDAPIQQRVSHLVTFFAPRRGGDEATTHAEINAAINANQLFIFLASNLSTGAINLSMYTLYEAAPMAMLVLSLYVPCITSLVLRLCI